jgi:hypothetical protein
MKESLQKYRSSAYSKNGVNQLWILKNSKELLENLESQGFSKIRMDFPHCIQQFLPIN